MLIASCSHTEKFWGDMRISYLFVAKNQENDPKTIHEIQK